MPDLYDNYGWSSIMESEETLAGFLAYVAKEGKPIGTYSGTPYLFLPVGEPEFWAHTKKGEAETLNFSALHIHSCGRRFWELVHSGIDITPKNASGMERIIMFYTKDGHGGMLPVDVITADVLPSFMEGDRIKLQIVAQPIDINYYADEEEYVNAQPKSENGKKWIPAPGALMPVQFLYNHSPERYEKDKEYETDKYVIFRATVKELYHGIVELDGKEEKVFIRCIADTSIGELEFDHTYQQVPEALRKNIKVGSIITGVCVLSGDAAIDEYENGPVRDFDHDLRLLRYTFQEGEAERLRSVLTEKTVYESECSGLTVLGTDAVINRFCTVIQNCVDDEDKYYAHLATITESENPEYPSGTRCIILARGDKDNYVALVFINVDESGMIEKLKVSKDSRFRFQLDSPPETKTPLDDIDLPGSVYELLIARARYHGIIGRETESESITAHMEDYYMFRDDAVRMLEALKEDPQPDTEAAMKNIMGYLFAKAMERQINDHRLAKTHTAGELVAYVPSDAFNGTISSSLPEEEHLRLEKAMHLGQQFFSDIMFYMKIKELDKDKFEETFVNAAIVVQRIGELGAAGMILKQKDPQ